MTEPEFFWPDGFAPDTAKLYIRNERTMNAPLSAVWAWLIAASRWSSWYSNAKNVRLPDYERDLAAEMSFTWSQTGVSLVSEVREFEPCKRLAWDARSPLITAYHTWDLQGDESACRVITDETQNGFMPTFLAPILKSQMRSVHDKWLALLEKQAASGLP